MTRVAIERQLEFYRRGGPSPFPVSPDEWEDRARQTLSPEAFGWVAGGAGAEDTMRANREAFFRWRLRPRMLRDVSERSIA
ncbi:MAG TPA: alpha-hydroxy-acid oxidizing protein, partial [Chloroflexota bacterium]